MGDYTRKLYQLALERGVSRTAPLTAKIEGPFGTASAAILDSEIAVLVAGGIGVTPFASVLESIILRASQLEPRKVYFYWLNREGAAFAWFFGLLSELERRDAHQIVDIRVFMTRGQGRSTSMLAQPSAVNRSRAWRQGSRHGVAYSNSHGSTQLPNGIGGNCRVPRGQSHRRVLLWSARFGTLASIGLRVAGDEFPSSTFERVFSVLGAGVL